ncbi:MAG: GntR family transcriptional regulator [Terriglobia bacterium]
MKGVLFSSIEQRSLRGRIAEEIQEAILTGMLREGERIVERKLAAQFSTSLTAVREALIGLEAKGFVVRKPNSATHIIRFSAQDAGQITAFRRVVEAHTVEEAARTASAAQLDCLEKASKELTEAALTREIRLYLQRDLALHETVWHASNNEYFEIALKRVVRPFFAFQVIRLASSETFDLAEDALRHLTFVNPIRARDPLPARIAYLQALDEWEGQTNAYVLGKSRKAEEEGPRS